MRANAVEREPARMSHWEKSELYQKMQEKNKGKNPLFCMMVLLHQWGCACWYGIKQNSQRFHFALQECPWFSYALPAGLGLPWTTD